MLKAVIFDLDGLLVDSTPLQQQAMRQFVESFGKIYLWPKSGREGMRIIDIVRDLKDIFDLPGRAEDLYKKRQEIYFELARRELRLFPGVLPFLAKLKQRKLRLALATSGDRDYVALIWEKFPRLKKYFSVVVTGEDVLRGKPYPDVYQKSLQKMYIRPEEAIVLEDSVNGIMSAKAAGIEVICVPNLHYPDADYSQADQIYPDLESVVQKIA